MQHVKGSSNHIANVLSRRPVWMNLDSTTSPDEGIGLDEEEDFAMIVMTRKPQLIKDNSLLRDLEIIGRKDPEYFMP